MAMMAYMDFIGQKSGHIDGPCIQKGREKTIPVIAASHSVVSPRDPQSGLPTGQRIHKPFVVTAELGPDTPLLYNVLCTNENASHVTIKYWTPQIKAQTGTGSEVQHYTIKLTISDSGGASTTTSLLTTVADGGLSGTTFSPQLNPGQPFSGMVAQFTDNDPVPLPLIHGTF